MKGLANLLSNGMEFCSVTLSCISPKLSIMGGICTIIGDIAAFLPLIATLSSSRFIGTMYDSVHIFLISLMLYSLTPTPSLVVLLLAMEKHLRTFLVV